MWVKWCVWSVYVSWQCQSQGPLSSVSQLRIASIWQGLIMSLKSCMIKIRLEWKRNKREEWQSQVQADSTLTDTGVNEPWTERSSALISRKELTEQSKKLPGILHSCCTDSQVPAWSLAFRFPACKIRLYRVLCTEGSRKCVLRSLPLSTVWI